MQRLHLGRASGVDHGLEELVLDLHGSRRTSRLLRLLGGNDDHRLAEVADAVDREHRLVAKVEPVQLVARNVLVRQDGVDAWQSQRRRDVDPGDTRVRMRAADGLPPEHPCDVQIARVLELARDLRHGIAADRGRLGVAPLQRARRSAHEPAARWTASRIFWYPVQRQRFPESASRISSSVGSAVRLSRSAVATTSPGVQKPHWTAPASANAACTGMKAVSVGKPLHRDDLVAVGLRGEHEAGADERPVEQDGARSALTLLAGVLRAGETEPVTQRREQALPRPHVGLEPLAVDGHRDPHVRHLSRARSVRTRKRMTPIGGRAANVVDRARRTGDLLRERPCVLDRRRHEPRHGGRGAECRPQLTPLAVDHERQRADGDHHRIARADLHEGLRLPGEPNAHAGDQLVRAKCRALRAEEELLERQTS